MVSQKAKGAIIAGAVVVAGGGLAYYLISRAAASAAPSVATMCFVTPAAGCTTTPTYTSDQTMQAQVTVPSSYNPVSVQAFVSGNPGSVHPWSIATTGFTYGIDFGPADFAAGTYPVYAIVTFADGSTATTNTVPVAILGASGECLPNQFPCYNNGAVTACCPDGEHCANADGSCPAGTTPDPSHPGCCASSSPTIYPRSFTGPGSVTALGQYCQPVSASIFAWNCCGTPASTKPSVSFAVQLIGSDGLPMTGAVVTSGALSVPGAPTVSFDQSSYVTNFSGFIYPTVTVDFLPTLCQAPSSSGTVKPSADPQIQFYADALPPSSGGPVLTTTVYVDLATTFVGGLAGTCGSCP